MMMHTFHYRDYDPREYPSVDPLPELTGDLALAQERDWLAMQEHPIKKTIEGFQVGYEQYPFSRTLPDPLEQLFLVAYGAHPLFGALAARRATRLMRQTHGALHEFEAMTLASDTFARYAFTLGLAYDCAELAADSAEAAGLDPEISAAWRARAAQIHDHTTA